jgi:hypothetical protein
LYLKYIYEYYFCHESHGAFIMLPVLFTLCAMPHAKVNGDLTIAITYGMCQ